jgi:outer membrane protein assembly factor BamA
LLGQQQQPGVQLVRVDSIQVSGNTRLATPVVLSELGFRTGDEITYADIQRGVQRLMATGEYDDVRVYAADDGLGRTTVIVNLVERPTIISYRFEGLEHIGSGAIRDTVGLESGQPLSRLPDGLQRP